MKSVNASNKALSLLFLIISLLITSFISSYYVSIEHNIYFWDSNGYWRFWQQFGNAVSENAASSAIRLISSVRNEDYNLLPVAIISPFYIFFGGSRLVYILSISLAYLLPVSILFSMLLRQVTQDKSVYWKALTLFLPLTFVAFWAPTLRGYPDICGIIFIIYAVYFSNTNDFSLQLNLKKAIFFGAVMLAPFLFRRWYAYTVVSLYISLPVLNYYFHNEGSHSLHKIKRIISFFFVSGSVSVFLSLMMQWNLLKRIATTDYSFIYSAYQSSVKSSLLNAAHDIGLYMIPVFLVSLCTSIYGKKSRKDYLVIFSAFNLSFSFFLFTKTQSPGLQHCLPFALWVLIASSLCLHSALSNLRSKLSQLFFVVIISLTCVFINKSSLFDKDSYWVDSYLPTKYLPMRVGNYESYLRLTSDIIGMMQDGEKLTVLSSSSVLNDNMLDTLSDQKLSHYITGASQVDLRDGLNLQSIMSKYFIVADPIQTHLSPSGQQVITIPADEMLKNYGIGKAFERVGAGYNLDNGVSAYIYRRIRPLTSEEITTFISRYYVSYPQWKDVYDTGFFVPFMTGRITLGDVWGRLDLESDGKIYAHPGENNPTSITWTVKGVKSLEISSIKNACHNADGVDVVISDSNGNQLASHVENNGSSNIDISQFNDRLVSLNISKHGNSSCDSIMVEAKY